VVETTDFVRIDPQLCPLTEPDLRLRILVPRCYTDTLPDHTPVSV